LRIAFFLLRRFSAVAIRKQHRLAKYALKPREDVLRRGQPSSVKTIYTGSGTGYGSGSRSLGGTGYGNVSRVLMIGDSMTVGGFGEAMQDYLVRRFGCSNVAVYASCGSSPEHWMRSGPNFITKCGYREQTPRSSIIYDFQNGQRPEPAVTPKLEDLVGAFHPTAVIVQLGTNWMEGMAPDVATSQSTYSKILDRFVAAVHSEPNTVRRIIWITPPDSSLYSPEVKLNVTNLIKAAARRDFFATIDSNSVTYYIPLDFRNQLAARGIELIVMPMPGKPCIDSEMMTASARQKTPLQNASFGDFKALMERQGVHLFDPVPLLIKRKAAAGGAPLYLETDTHWCPETMEFVAQQLAAFLGALSPLQEARLRVAEKEIAAYGDILTMLKLPAGQKIYNPQKITIKQVLVGNALWRPNKDARVLLLGDSFCNIFSLEPMGWGESAGFAEHLSRALGGQPLDCILRNSDGAFATREILSRELARGRDRLAGKKVVVWEFAVRELAFGNWKPLEMKTGQAQPAHFLSLRPGEETLVTGTIEAVSTVPLVGSEPYKDHIFTVHLVDIAGPEHPEPESLQALVCLWSMRDNVLTPAARLRPGDRITVRLRSWTDVSGQYEKINRSEIDDPAVQLEEPVWGDVMN
jgi:SGNH hydrolase-like domain, acetyltransferase AlgX